MSISNVKILTLSEHRCGPFLQNANSKLNIKISVNHTLCSRYKQNCHNCPNMLSNIVGLLKKSLITELFG